MSCFWTKVTAFRARGLASSKTAKIDLKELGHAQKQGCALLLQSHAKRVESDPGALMARLVGAVLLLASHFGQCFTWQPMPLCSRLRTLHRPSRGASSVFALARCRSSHVPEEADAFRDTFSRREMIAAGSALASVTILPDRSAAAASDSRSGLVRVSDPSTYSALAYAPPGARGKLPLIVVLHGAGKNRLDAWSLADPKGEHAGLAPSLLQTGRAPVELSQNFAVVAPYSAGKRSFYEEPRKNLLQFVEWACSNEGRAAGVADVDPSQVFLFGFSDGATVGVELMTTGRFRAGVFAAYGFTGQLPALALQRLKDIPIWIFHSADDVIFPVKCSDQLVSSLRKVEVPAK